MSAIKQAVSWWCFVEGEVTPQKLLRAAADIGYAACEAALPYFLQQGRRAFITGRHEFVIDPSDTIYC